MKPAYAEKTVAPSYESVVSVACGSRGPRSGLTVLPATNSMIPAMYWHMPPKNIIVVIIMLGASTPRVPIPVRDTRKTLVAKERRPSGAGFARRR